MKKTFTIQEARKDTPGCGNTLHFNNAGAALMPQCVVDQVNSYFLLESQIGGYEAAKLFENEIAGFYQAAASLINAKPQEIAYIENATRAWDMVFYSLDFKAGDTIITTHAEYASNYIAFLHMSKKTGARVEVLPEGFTLEDLKNKINKSVKLIALTHIPAYGGTITPVEEIGQIAREAGIFYLVDAVQSIGQFRVDVEKIQCDALCVSGRKFLRAPRGTGFLYVRESRIENLHPPFLDLQSASWTSRNTYEIKKGAIRFETWERNYSNLLGLKKAIEYAAAWNEEVIWERIQHLSSLLRKKLSSLQGVDLLNPSGKCGIVAFTAKGKDCQELLQSLKEKGMNVSLLRLRGNRILFEQKGMTDALRASLHYYNTEEEIECFCIELKNSLR